ncbi:phosphopantetheine-binding protein [Actinoallomurus acaciae]|uniref:Phosphopantetheine-binding protein n=1 Tax=Actinoallomurus acaciae TaxID=502577 RepID=A0ABV5Y880_9ACTN
MRVTDREVVVKDLTQYIQEHMLNDESVELTAETPLLEWGILNSVGTARLVGYIRNQFDIRVPPGQMIRQNFQDINRIADLVGSLGETKA